MAAACPCGRSMCQWQHCLQVAMEVRDRCIYLDQYINTTLARWSEHDSEYQLMVPRLLYLLTAPAYATMSCTSLVL
jgi:hypothetical protein